jgi:hypothetical protein
MAPTAGLTYNLDRRAARARPGAPELVATGVALAHVVDVVACGCPEDLGLTPARTMDAHRVYSDYVSDRRSLAEILISLEAAIS